VTGAPNPDEALVRDLAHRILDRPEYASWHASGSLDWLGRLGTWLASLFFDNPALFWTIVGVLTLLLVLIVTHVSWTIRKGLAARPPVDADGALEPAPSYVDDAAAFAAGGHYLDASRAIQLGAIQLLIERGRLRLERSDSNRVLGRKLRDARMADALRQDLLTAITRLERDWFRDRHDDEDLYRLWQRAYAALASEVAAA
jgi:hypothetical protein